MDKTTNDEQEIRNWASLRRAHPVEIRQFVHDSQPAILGFVFGDVPVAKDILRPISWEQFFAMFHLMGLMLAYGVDNDYALLKLEEDPSSKLDADPMQA